MSKGKVVGINGNLVTAEVKGPVSLNEVAYVCLGNIRLKAEVIRITGDIVELQVFEDTQGIAVNDMVDFSAQQLSVELGPGLLGTICDGLQNPLTEIAKKSGYFLPRGVYLSALSQDKEWNFRKKVREMDEIYAGDSIGIVSEGIFDHQIMLPFYLKGPCVIKKISNDGTYTLSDTIAQVEDQTGQLHDITMSFYWPVRRPIRCYEERLRPHRTMVTKVRVIDTLLPVALGGTYCIPGPFGAGKTVLQHITSKNAEVDIVVIIACGERAGEVVEVLREFPKLVDPRTNRSLMERTVIVCNTSSMPVAAREASVYTGVSIAEYYRQMGLHVLLLADSTSRWAQAMREMSGRLEEIPGEEAFPAYLESVIAAFYERAGIVRLRNGKEASVTIGGSVSPAGGNFEEPVTQATLKVVGAFHGLSRERAEARKYPAIDPLESWSHYDGSVDPQLAQKARWVLKKGNDVAQMMKVVGEEGTHMEDYTWFLKANFFDAVYLQQNAFDPVDQAVSIERQTHVFSIIMNILSTHYSFVQKEEARQFFYQLRQHFLDYNSTEWQSADFIRIEKKIKQIASEKKQKIVTDKKEEKA